ncbi:hypothetical protein IQ235_06250 [Oscillatoriales cyanobacterium LEGE 11467]|uniref:Uncharacterized protein n=1 Tax=Zarconia navalis LEGE 11467 TaxID=1828826 RepID=A0A928VYC8_9CYAN|nr:hypothetical protein [Zarconia navalis]MBE9040393.1 hypothetical protein [Zarconia navalis LEGE 11467]
MSDRFSIETLIGKGLGRERIPASLSENFYGLSRDGGVAKASIGYDFLGISWAFYVRAGV